MNKNTARKAETNRRLVKQRTPEHHANTIRHGANAFEVPHKAINRRAKSHPNSWRVRVSKAVKATA